jgi:hypothetical protein
LYLFVTWTERSASHDPPMIGGTCPDWASR